MLCHSLAVAVVLSTWAAVGLATGSTPAYSLATYRRADGTYGGNARGMRHRLYPMAVASRSAGSAVLVDLQSDGATALTAAIGNKNVTGVLVVLPHQPLDIPTTAALHLLELQVLGQRKGRPVSIVAVPAGEGVQWAEVGSTLHTAATEGVGAKGGKGSHLWDFNPLRSIQRVSTDGEWEVAAAQVHTVAVGPPGWRQAGSLLLITAHTDCLTMFPALPGCFDANGSGLAVLLALLRAASKETQQGSPTPVLLFTGGGVLHWAGLQEWLSALPSPVTRKVSGVVSLERLGGSPDGPLFAHWACDAACPDSPQWGALQARVLPAVQRSEHWPVHPQAPRLWPWEGHAAAAAGHPAVTLAAAAAPGDSAEGVQAGQSKDTNTTKADTSPGGAMREAGFVAAGALGGRWSFLDSEVHLPSLSRRCADIAKALLGATAPHAGWACGEGALGEDVAALTAAPRSPWHMGNAGHQALQHVREAAESAGWEHETLSTVPDVPMATNFAMGVELTATLKSVRPFSWEMEAFFLTMLLGLAAYLLAAGPRTCPCWCYRAGPVWQWVGYASLTHTE